MDHIRGSARFLPVFHGSVRLVLGDHVSGRPESGRPTLETGTAPLAIWRLGRGPLRLTLTRDRLVVPRPCHAGQ
jgi:hypothetical protein